MTDIIDIKALREDIAVCKELGRFDVDVPLHIMTRVLDQLEAERQRADWAVKVKDNDEQTALYWAKIAAKKLAEIASLKGDQVPYAYSYNYAGCETCEGFQDWRKELSRERPPEWMIETGKVTDLVELFSAPQKPVVKLAGDMARGSIGYSMYAKGWNDRGLADKLEIYAAGGIVKDGE